MAACRGASRAMFPSACLQVEWVQVVLPLVGGVGRATGGCLSAVLPPPTLPLGMLPQERSAVSFVLPLAHVSPDFKTRLRDAVIPNILKHLTIKRPPSQDRSEYYVHAEAFAALVSIELVAIQGALQVLVLVRLTLGCGWAGVCHAGEGVWRAGGVVEGGEPFAALLSARHCGRAMRCLGGDAHAVDEARPSPTCVSLYRHCGRC